MTFLSSKEFQEQIEGFKKTLRVYYEGDITYSYRLSNFRYPYRDDADIQNILNAFDIAYTMDDLENFYAETRLTAFQESDKIAFIYDTDQKFTEERRITLEQYPEDLALGFDRKTWIEKCRENNEKSVIALPNALSDALTDLIVTKTGHTVIRVLHGAFDWNQEGGVDLLEDIIQKAKKTAAR